MEFSFIQILSLSGPQISFTFWVPSTLIFADYLLLVLIFKCFELSVGWICWLLIYDSLSSIMHFESLLCSTGFLSFLMFWFSAFSVFWVQNASFFASLTVDWLGFYEEEILYSLWLTVVWNGYEALVIWKCDLLPGYWKEYFWSFLLTVSTLSALMNEDGILAPSCYLLDINGVWLLSSCFFSSDI